MLVLRNERGDIDTLIDTHTGCISYYKYGYLKQYMDDMLVETNEFVLLEIDGPYRMSKIKTVTYQCLEGIIKFINYVNTKLKQIKWLLKLREHTRGKLSDIANAVKCTISLKVLE